LAVVKLCPCLSGSREWLYTQCLSRQQLDDSLLT